MRDNNSNIILASTEQCSGCSACASACPTDSITMLEDKEGFLQPHIDVDTCIKCHKCEKTCPIIKPVQISADYETRAFAVINKDEGVRLRSSSGGVFYALAKWTIGRGGVVFGARFNENWEVVHDYTETIDGIEPFMRSKYVQSKIGDTYKQAKEFLKAGKKVLYVGTPCQIGGLQAYLGEDYENLLKVDIICHGVPSPKVWREYLTNKVLGDKVLNVNFRDKRDGWKDFQCVTTTTTTTTTRERQNENLFFRGFVNNVYLRQSCYDCQFKQLHRVSDITMADYWGIQDFCPQMDDNKGTSAVFIHSAKGEQVLNQISDDILQKEQDIDNVLACNSMMTQSVALPSKRRRFYFYYRWLPFNWSKYVIDKDWMTKRIYRKINKVIKKVYKQICKN